MSEKTKVIEVASAPLDCSVMLKSALFAGRLPKTLPSLVGVLKSFGVTVLGSCSLQSREGGWWMR